MILSCLLSLGVAGISCTDDNGGIGFEPREGGSRPTGPNRPVLPALASAETATFIDPTATITGAKYILLGRQIYIGPFARLLADENSSQESTTKPEVDDIQIRIEDETNVQDNVTIYAHVERSAADQQKVKSLLLHGVEIGERVILAHGSSVKGPAQIGIEGTDIDANPDDDQEVFLSFGSEVDGAILEKNTGISALGRVGPGVRLRSGFIVLPGKNVTTQQEADNPALGKVRLIVEADVEFNEGVLEVNVAFAREYTKLYRDNPSYVRGINYDPGNTAFNPERDLPHLAGQETRVPGFRNRIIGEVELDNTLPELLRVMGNEISIRADEGEPFVIGKIASMDNKVIFHALEETPIQTGDNVSYGEQAIVHGGGRRPLLGGGDNEPTIIEDDVKLKRQAVVFRSLIGQGATIGEKSAIVNTDVAPGTIIQDRVIYINNTLFGQVEW
ncbi:LbetaH domain-containing protein [Hymenobacter roseosalivarius]|uniref:acetyltransferase n=1 Tax=Hymenobacter roseosalivarius TaxID=89967 RepID=UPI001356332A|nr:acetyltransferase [Hymenobacter roseosalivarius]